MFLLLAVIDSINPSAIVVTLYLISMAGSRALVQVAVYVGTIFITYLLLGVMMVLGIESLLKAGARTETVGYPTGVGRIDELPERVRSPSASEWSRRLTRASSGQTPEEGEKERA